MFFHYIFILTTSPETTEELIFKHINTTICICQDHNHKLLANCPSSQIYSLCETLTSLIAFLDNESKLAIELLASPTSKSSFSNDIYSKITKLKNFKQNIDNFHIVEYQKPLSDIVKSFFCGIGKKSQNDILENPKKEMIYYLNMLITLYETYFEGQTNHKNKQDENDINNKMTSISGEENDTSY